MTAARTDVAAAIRDSLPITVAVAPFAAVFGGLAVQAGWAPWQALLASATIFAGASQYVALDLWGRAVPAWAIVLTVFAVNFRHVLYSASIGRRMGAWAPWKRALCFAFMVDPAFAAADARARTHGLTFAYFLAYGAALWVGWMAMNAVGVVFGALIESPERWGLDFILPIYFLALVVGMRGQRRFAGIVVVSALVAVSVQVVAGSPWHIMAGGVAGMAYAALRPAPTVPA